MVKIGDFILYILIAVFTIVLLILNKPLLTDRKLLVVQVNNQTIINREIRPREKGVVSFKLKNGYEAQVEIAEGKVRMLPMPKNICPEGICSDTGWTAGEKPIVCAPNRIMVKLTGNKSDHNDLDEIT